MKRITFLAVLLIMSSMGYAQVSTQTDDPAAARLVRAEKKPRITSSLSAGIAIPFGQTNFSPLGYKGSDDLMRVTDQLSLRMGVLCGEYPYVGIDWTTVNLAGYGKETLTQYDGMLHQIGLVTFYRYPLGHNLFYIEPKLKVSYNYYSTTVSGQSIQGDFHANGFSTGLGAELGMYIARRSHIALRLQLQQGVLYKWKGDTQDRMFYKQKGDNRSLPDNAYNDGNLNRYHQILIGIGYGWSF